MSRNWSPIHLLATAVLILTTLGASLLTLIAIPVLASSLEGTGYFTQTRSIAFIVLMLLAGWYGLIVAWRLLLHFRKSTQAPTNPLINWLGLLSGSVVSTLLFLAGLQSGNLYFVLLGTPLLVSGYLAVRLIGARATA